MKQVVGFSGGVDSQACALMVRRKFPAEDVILLNSQAGRNEHPVTNEFVKWYSANVFPVIETIPLVKDMGTRGTKPGQCRDRRQEFSDDDELTFDRLAYIQGRFPSRKAQFCTKHLKLAPQMRWCEENLTAKGILFERHVGVRCDESERRKDTPESKFDEYFQCVVNYPIRCWTKMECFAVLRAAGEDVNPLYSMGFSRVGCAPCINSGKDDVREWAARFPEMIDKVRSWEKSVGRTFFAPTVPGMEINWVDDVVAWSKTARGGKQPLMAFTEIEAASGACSSKYGLCE
jgi:3'-phosphoadenosine 5'-phosphosulfate sulfotransferase (PAPS reductase)/FAD synthetase